MIEIPAAAATADLLAPRGRLLLHRDQRPGPVRARRGSHERAPSRRCSGPRIPASCAGFADVVDAARARGIPVTHVRRDGGRADVRRAAARSGDPGVQPDAFGDPPRPPAGAFAHARAGPLDLGALPALHDGRRGRRLPSPRDRRVPARAPRPRVRRRRSAISSGRSAPGGASSGRTDVGIAARPDVHRVATPDGGRPQVGSHPTPKGRRGGRRPSSAPSREVGPRHVEATNSKPDRSRHRGPVRQGRRADVERRSRDHGLRLRRAALAPTPCPTRSRGSSVRTSSTRGAS